MPTIKYFQIIKGGPENSDKHVCVHEDNYEGGTMSYDYYVIYDEEGNEYDSEKEYQKSLASEVDK